MLLEHLPHAQVHNQRRGQSPQEPSGSRRFGGRLKQQFGSRPRGAHRYCHDGDEHFQIAADPLGAQRHLDDIKPTRGLVSLAEVVPLAPSLDVAGPMARGVADCALLLVGMAPAGQFRWEPESSSTLAGVRIALSPRTASVSLDPDVAEGFEQAIAACRRLGRRS